MKISLPNFRLLAIVLFILCSTKSKAQQQYRFITLDSVGKPQPGVLVSNKSSVYGESDASGNVEVEFADNITYLRFEYGNYYNEIRLDTIPKIGIYTLKLSHSTVASTAPISSVSGLNSGVNPKLPVANRSFSINFDEDFLAFFDNQDRNYTGGLSVDFFRDRDLPVCRYTVINFDNLIGYLGKPIHLTPHKGRINIISGISVGVTGFTPDRLNEPAVIYDDRPYASLTYINFVRTSLTKAGNRDPSKARSLVSTDFTVGILGLHLYHGLQSGIHVIQRKINGRPTPYDPKGWNNQISNGGEPTLNYTFMKKWVGVSKGFQVKGRKRDIPFGFQLSYGYRLSMGYFTGLSTDVLVRFGIIKSNILYFDTYKFGFSSQLTKEDKGFEVFPFAGFRPIVALRNNLISGQFKESAHTFSPITEANLILMEWDYGIGISFNKNSSLYFFYRQRTPEGRKSAGYPQRIHSWAGIYFNQNF